MDSDKISKLVILMLELIVLGANRQATIDKLSAENDVS